MASKQVIAYGATVERSTDGSLYTEIPEVKSLAVPEVEQEYPEVTNLDSPNGYREYIRGLKDPGQIELLAGYTSDGFSQQLSDQDEANPIYYRVTLATSPDQSSVGDCFTFQGYPTPRMQPGDLGAPVDMRIVIRVTGEFSWVEGV